VTATEELRTVRADLVSRRFRERIDREFARRHLLLSQGRESEIEHLAVADSTGAVAIHNAGVRLGVPVQPRCADAESIGRVVDEVYGRGEDASSIDDASNAAPLEPGEIERLLADADRDLLSTQGKGPVVRLVDALLFEALGRGASDVHVQPLADRTLVRYRLDGILHTAREIPPSVTPALVSRIKVMGRMDIAERRVPQDGRASVSLGPRPVDLRLSTLPTSHGERAVIRLLDNAAGLCDLDALGMPPDVVARFLDRVGRSSGIILLTGPTGSGKTTTLYATLRHLGRAGGAGGVNLMTIEDPIEYELSGLGLAISQSQTNERKGVNFATGLRHLLRQDPDVIMIGEIRDAETARIAMQSSLTGHLVLSTLHTNDAPAAVSRLVDLGVEPYLVSASLSAVMAQRLVRRRHEPCRGAGCEDCFGTGYRGRRGLFELLVVDEPLRQHIAGGKPVSIIRNAARHAGTRTLAAEGRRLVRLGETTLDEVRRVTEDEP
jgi:general secretion pathway protein E